MSAGRLRRLRTPGGIALLALVAVPAAGSAQSLGEVAQREEQRRGAVKSGRVYTDADLPQGYSAPAPPVEASPSSATPGPQSGAGVPVDQETPAKAEAREKAPAQPGAPGTVVEGREKRDEEYWRNRARNTRGRLARAIADVEAARARLEAIDAGPATPTAAREREVIAASLPRLEASVGSLRTEVEQFEARARIENVPPDWTR